MSARADAPPPSGGTATRRRGRALEQAIYQAVFDELRRVGYAGLTMDGVAAAARTGKAPLYRRWPDKDALLRDALMDRLPAADDIELVGELRADLLAVLRFLSAACALTKDPALQVAKSESQETHAMMRERVSVPTRRMLLEILRDAEARGEIRQGAATPLLAHVGPAVVTYRNLTAPMELTDEFVVEVVDDVLLPMLRPQG
ncbi:TetR/AcrR family transcriptional regulator [Yinghuangia sp. YIM S09857]|uniref:TetR/AcrR family transcriptional regulator n=1 Tax=Yinghuangia sp. YIM S09857 TaxID=3436929 RepID=UPI003F538991